MMYAALTQYPFLYFPSFKFFLKNKTFWKPSLLLSSGNEAPNLLGPLDLKGQSPKKGDCVND